MNEMKTLIIGFEDCKTISFDAREVAAFSINGITRDLYNNWYNNKIQEVQKTSDVMLILLPDANKAFSKKETTFKRMQRLYNITDITIIKSDYSLESVTPIWSRESSTINSYQSVSSLSDGSLVVVISTKRTAEEIKEKLNEKIRRIDEQDKSLGQSIDENHGRWVKMYGKMTAEGDPVYKCSNCGCDEHAYGMEHTDKHTTCRNCGIRNIYPWEMEDE